MGSSDDLDNRIKAHETSPRTTRHGGIKSIVAPMTQEQPNLRSWEREETIFRMMEHGINRVRGWNYCQDIFDKDTLIAIKDNIIGTHDLCHRCGFFGHFAKHCSTPTCRVAGWLFEWISLYERERPIPDSRNLQGYETTEAVKLQRQEYKKSLLEQDQIPKESVLEDFGAVEADRRKLTDVIPQFSRQEVLRTFIDSTTAEKLTSITNDYGKTGLSECSLWSFEFSPREGDYPSLADRIMGKLIEQLVANYKAENDLHFPDYPFEHEMPKSHYLKLREDCLRELGVPITRECLGCQVDIADRPEHHERCYPCWKQLVNRSP